MIMTVYICPPNPPYGKERRAAIKKMFNDVPDGDIAELCVNMKYRPQIKSDPDLRKLIKDGFLKQIRVNQYAHIRTHKGPFKKPGQRRTFLVKA